MEKKLDTNKNGQKKENTVSSSVVTCISCFKFNKKSKKIGNSWICLDCQA